LVAIAFFLPGRARDLSAPSHGLQISDNFGNKVADIHIHKRVPQNPIHFAKINNFASNDII